MAGISVTRENVLGLRFRAQGLDRRDGGADRVLGLGLQDTPYGSARAAWSQRRPGAEPAGPQDGMLVWSWRGAPHLHRAADLRTLAAALWPISDADATKRIATSQIRDGAKRGIEAFTLAAEAMREVVTRRMTKGEVSGAVSAQIPADLSYDCPTCDARHISGALFQAVGLFAGVRVLPEGNSTLLEPLPAEVRPEAVPTVAKGTPDALRQYVTVLGPATVAHLAGFLGTSVTAAKGVLPDGLVEVEGPGGPAFVTEEAAAEVTRAKPPRSTLLLPASDPWLQARDRDLVVPRRDLQKEVWKVLANPGVLLVDGEVAGTWRAKLSGRKLVLTLTAFDELAADVRSQVADEAARIAELRGAADVSVRYA